MARNDELVDALHENTEAMRALTAAIERGGGGVRPGEGADLDAGETGTGRGRAGSGRGGFFSLRGAGAALSPLVGAADAGVSSFGIGGTAAGARSAQLAVGDLAANIPIVGSFFGFKDVRDVRQAATAKLEGELGQFFEAGLDISEESLRQNVELTLERQRNRVRGAKRIAKAVDESPQVDEIFAESQGVQAIIGALDAVERAVRESARGGGPG